VMMMNRKSKRKSKRGIGPSWLRIACKNIAFIAQTIKIYSF